MADTPIQHVYLGEGPPPEDLIPAGPGAHYIDTAYYEPYLAVGVGESLGWFGPISQGRLEINSEKPTDKPDHVGQMKVAGTMIWLATGTLELQNWIGIPVLVESFSQSDSLANANGDGPQLQMIHWAPSANNAPHVLQAPAWANNTYQNQQFILVRPDASQLLRLEGMADLYCNLPSVLNGGAAEVTLTSPVNLVHVTHAPGCPWIVRIEPLQAPA